MENNKEKSEYLTIGYGKVNGGTNCNVIGENSLIVGGTSNSLYGKIFSHSIKATDFDEDKYFMEESKKLDGELIMKYSPIDFKWKIYNNGKYDKVENIKINGGASKTQLFKFNGKTIGVLIIKVDTYDLSDYYVIN